MNKTATKITIESITIKHIPDEYADMSYLETELSEDGKTIISSCQYSQDELDKHPAQTKRYIEQDKQRLANYGRTWYCIGIKAEAEVKYPIGQGNYRLEWLSSSGLWGIETDSETDYIKEVEQEQLSELKEHLNTFGIDTSNFDSIEVKHPSY